MCSKKLSLKCVLKLIKALSNLYLLDNLDHYLAKNNNIDN